MQENLKEEPKPSQYRADWTLALDSHQHVVQRKSQTVEGEVRRDTGAWG